MADINNIMFGSAAALPILVFVVQTLRELVVIQERTIPAVVLGVAMTMLLFAAYAPAHLVEVVAAAFILATAGSMSVRYVKEGKHQTVRTVKPAPASIREARDI
jgi:hypothetical protein